MENISRSRHASASPSSLRFSKLAHLSSVDQDWGSSLFLPSWRPGDSRLTPSEMVAVKFETEVKPPVWDRYTGQVVRPAGAGKTVCIILSDDEGGEPQTPVQSFKREPRIKVEGAGRGRLQTADIKSEDEDEGVSKTLTPGSHQTLQSQAGTSRRRGHHVTASPRTPSRPPRSPNPGLKNSPSDNPDSDGTPSSSFDDDSSSLSDDSDAEAESGLEESSTFRPSRSPSRFAETPSPTTRSRKAAHPGAGEGAQVPVPHGSSTTATTQSTSVSSPPRISFSIPIPVANRPIGPSSRSQVTQQVVPSPANSRVHGWRPINRGQTAARTGPSTSGEQPSSHRGRGKSPGPPVQINSTSARVPSPNASLEESASQHSWELTAGPCSSGQAVAEDQGPAAQRASGAKPKARADGIENAKPVDAEDMIQSDKMAKCKGRAKDEEHSKPKKKSKKKSKRKSKIKGKGKGKVMSEKQEQSYGKHHTRHGPSRQARIERTIEETPEPQLQTLGSFSAHQSIVSSPPARTESEMFVSSPIRPATPGPSRPPTSNAAVKALERYPTPIASSPCQYNLKRTRTDFEEAGPGIGDPVAESCQERYALIKDLWIKERAGRERVERMVELQESRLRFLQDQFDDQEAHINNTGTQVDETHQSLGALKKRIDALSRRLQEGDRAVGMRLEQLELERMRATRPATAAPRGPSGPRPQPHIKPMTRGEFYGHGRQSGANPPPRSATSNTLAGPPPPSAPGNHAQQTIGRTSPFRPAQSGSQSSGYSGQPNEGAPHLNRSVLEGLTRTNTSQL